MTDVEAMPTHDYITQHHIQRMYQLPTDESRWTLWPLFARVLTFPIFSCCLSTCGMRDTAVQQAWREKIALCILIVLLSAAFGFLTFGFAAIACKPSVPIFPSEVLAKHGENAAVTQRYMIVRGQLFKAGEYFTYGYHRPIAPLTDADLSPIVTPLYGRDISAFFPPNPLMSPCQKWPQSVLNNTCELTTIYPGVDPSLLHCHRSVQSIEELRNLAYSYVAFSWDNVTHSNRKLFVIDDSVYDITNYLIGSEKYLGDDSVTIALERIAGTDATRMVQIDKNLQSIRPCIESQFFVGKLNGDSIGCVASNIVVLFALIILLALSAIKFISALTFNLILSWKLGTLSAKPRTRDIPHVMLLVTCYSENEEGIRCTFDSLAATTYSAKHKILICIADGFVTGAGNMRSTPEICLDLMDSPETDDVHPEAQPRSYIAVGDGPLRHNMAQVYAGTYTAITGETIPYILINKCGTAEERAKGSSGKPGNRGKRDSQLILMNWLSKVLFNERMTPLEFDMFEKLRDLTGLTPDRYELMLMVDADTAVKPDSLRYMVAAMDRDQQIMGLCGETQIANKFDSFVTMIQVCMHL